MTSYPAQKAKLSGHWASADIGRSAKDVKNEGASGDIHENKGTEKSARRETSGPTPSAKQSEVCDGREVGRF
jgi:hypothetical protein